MVQNGQGLSKVLTPIHVLPPFFSCELHYPHDLIVEEIMSLFCFSIFLFHFFLQLLFSDCLACSHVFSYHVQGNRGERQRLRRIMDRETLKDARFQKQRSGRTPSGVDLDAEIMQRNVPIMSTADRVFLAVCCPMPCFACRRMRCGSQVPMSCECTFFAIRGRTAKQFDPLKRPKCPICRTERYRDGDWQNCACISRCREYCLADGLWK